MAKNEAVENRIKAARERLRAENLARLGQTDPPDVAPRRDARVEPEPTIEQVAQTVQPEATVPEVPVDDMAEQLRKLQARFAYVEGNLKAQGEQFRTHRLEWESERLALMQQLEDAKRQAAEAKAEREREKPVSDEDLSRYFTEAQIKEMGADSCRAMLLMVRNESGQATKSLVQNELASIRAELAAEKQSLAASRLEAFNAAVFAQVPDWKVIDEDPKFHAWLEEMEGFTGKTRRQFGIEAKQSLDSNRFAAVYIAFKKTIEPNKSIAGTLPRQLPVSRPPADVRPNSPAQVTGSDILALAQAQRQGQLKDPASRASMKERIAAIMNTKQSGRQ